MTEPPIESEVLAMHRGDPAALQRLVATHLPWIETQVRARLSAAVRRDGDTQDFVQDALIEVLRDGPRFVIDSTAGFRALLLRIVENNLRDRVRHQHRQCRDVRRERELAGDSVLLLDAPARSVTEPPAQAERHERAAWLRLALELLEPEDREVIRLREWEGRTFGEIGATLGVGEEAVRKRYGRALPRLAQKLELLRRGQWRQTLGDGLVG